MRKPLHVLTFGAYIAACAAVRLLPPAPAFLFGRTVGTLGGLFAFRRKEIAVQNIMQALGLPRREAEKLASAAFAKLGANLAGMVKMQTMAPADILQRLAFSIPDSGLLAGGCVVATLHAGNWELLGRLPQFLPAVRFGAIYQKLANPAIEARMRAQRAKWGLHLFDRTNGIWEAVAFLEGGGALGVLCDQYAGTSGTVLPFFGRPASTSTLPGLLACRAGVPILPVSVSTTGIARWKISAGEPIRANSPEAAAEALNRSFEQTIREHPDEWLWAHDRWKNATPPQKSLP